MRFSESVLRRWYGRLEDRFTGDSDSSSLFYIEYSSQFGGTAAVEAAATVLDETHLLYGGRIDSAQKANTVLDSGADTIVVGDCFYEDREAYRQTTRVDY